MIWTATAFGDVTNMGSFVQPPAIVLAAEEAAWVYVTGGESFSDDRNNYFTAWYDVPSKSSAPAQRFIVCRLIVPLEVARQVRDQANKVWTRGGH